MESMTRTCGIAANRQSGETQDECVLRKTKEKLAGAAAKPKPVDNTPPPRSPIDIMNETINALVANHTALLTKLNVTQTENQQLRDRLNALNTTVIAHTGNITGLNTTLKTQGGRIANLTFGATAQNATLAKQKQTLNILNTTTNNVQRQIKGAAANLTAVIHAFRQIALNLELEDMTVSSILCANIKALSGGDDNTQRIYSEQLACSANPGVIPYVPLNLPKPNPND